MDAAIDPITPGCGWSCPPPPDPSRWPHPSHWVSAAGFVARWGGLVMLDLIFVALVWGIFVYVHRPVVTASGAVVRRFPRAAMWLAGVALAAIAIGAYLIYFVNLNLDPYNGIRVWPTGVDAA